MSASHPNHIFETDGNHRKPLLTAVGIFLATVVVTCRRPADLIAAASQRPGRSMA